MKKIILGFSLLLSANGAFAVDTEEQGRELFYQTCLGVKSQQAKGKLRATLKKIVKEKRAAFPDLPEPDLSHLAKLSVGCDLETGEMQLSNNGRTHVMKLVNWRENTFSVNGTKVVWHRRDDAFASNWRALHQAFRPRQSWMSVILPEAHAELLTAAAIVSLPVVATWIGGTTIAATGATAFCVVHSWETTGQCLKGGAGVVNSLMIQPVANLVKPIVRPLYNAERRANSVVIDRLECPSNGSNKITVEYVALAHADSPGAREQTVIELNERGEAIASQRAVTYPSSGAAANYLAPGARDRAQVSFRERTVQGTRYEFQNATEDRRAARAGRENRDQAAEGAKFFAEVCRSPRRVRYYQSQINEWRRQRGAGSGASGAPAPAAGTENSISAGSADQGR